MNIQRICDLYHRAACTPSDINEHVPTLMRLARMCEHVTEFGTRTGVSTSALLRGEPRRLVTYDLCRHPEVDELALAALEAGIDFRFVCADTREAEIEGTDLLFIDTLHTFGQASRELLNSGHKVRRFIALHDTVSYGSRGEDADDPGLFPAIEAYFGERQGLWKLIDHWTNNNGFTLFMRRGEFHRCE